MGGGLSVIGVPPTMFIQKLQALLVCQPGVGFLTAEVARSSMKCRPNFYHSRRVALSSTACGVCITAKMPNQTHQTRGFMASFLRIRRAKNTIKYYLTQCASSLGWLQINVFFSIVKHMKIYEFSVFKGINFSHVTCDLVTILLYRIFAI